MLKVLAVCGAGLGSSLACQMAIQQALDNLGVEAKVSHTDTTTVSSICKDYDMVACGNNFRSLIEKKNLPVPVIYLDRLVDKKEITSKLMPLLEERGLVG